ncbi:MAG: hypothetical protein J0M32_20245, partial [Candidatus Accumulibacter sp.]|nr:hypothetical protein [Accumulibacter sp.]
MTAPTTARGAFELLVEGDVLYARMLADVAASQSHVRLASYIWADDDVGRRFAHALLERHVAGVSVRVAVDAFGKYTLWAVEAGVDSVEHPLAMSDEIVAALR